MEKKITIELPSLLKLPDGEIESRIKKELAIRLYEQEILSFGQARKVANMTKWEFIDCLKKEGSGILYDKQELEKDLETLQEFG